MKGELGGIFLVDDGHPLQRHQHADEGRKQVEPDAADPDIGQHGWNEDYGRDSADTQVRPFGARSRWLIG